MIHLEEVITSMITLILYFLLSHLSFISILNSSP